MVAFRVLGETIISILFCSVCLYVYLSKIKVKLIIILFGLVLNKAHKLVLQTFCTFSVTLFFRKGWKGQYWNLNILVSEISYMFFFLFMKLDLTYQKHLRIFKVYFYLYGSRARSRWHWKIEVWLRSQG